MPNSRAAQNVLHGTTVVRRVVMVRAVMAECYRGLGVVRRRYQTMGKTYRDRFDLVVTGMISRTHRLHHTRVRSAVALLLFVLCAGCARTQRTSAIDRLAPCTADQGPTDAYCGTYRVYEDRDAKQGRQLDLRIVVLPALETNAKPDPVFFLAGGPGQGAAEMAAGIKELLRRVQTARDIVLVDQRGTGKSHPLTCEPSTDRLADLDAPDEVGLARLRTCMTGYDADLTKYITPLAMDDLDEVRAFLGYEQINVVGGSYGTRAGLVYLRQHGDRVRTIVLDGVAPTDMRLPMFFARDAQRALDKLLANCEADTACRAAYPNLGRRVRALFERLEAAPPRVSLTHPRTGESGELVFRAAHAASVLHGALYSPLVSSLVPALIERAERNDFQGLLALGMMNEALASNIAVGLQLSVLCSEDDRFITSQDLEAATAGSVFARHLLSWRVHACAMWPKAQLPPGYREPVSSDVPALILSGELDPVTPPEWGAQAATHLSRSTHVVATGTGHGVLSTGCGQRLVRAFIESGSAQGLDIACASTIERPPFFLTLAGPDPLVHGTKAGQ